MSQQRAGYREMNADVIGGLFGVAAMALGKARATYDRIDLEDVETMLDMYGVLWPGNPEVSFFRGMLAVTRANWREAADIFHALAAASQSLPRSRAMLAYALRYAGDPGWRDQAEALRESSDPNTRLMVCSLIGQDELERAIELCGPDGAQQAAVETLALAERLREEANAAPNVETASAATTQRTLTPEVPYWMNFRLRV